MSSPLFPSIFFKKFILFLPKGMITFGSAAADPGSAAELDSAVA